MCGPQKKTNHRSDSVLHFLPQKFLSPRQKLVWQVLVRVDKLQQVELSVCPFPPLLPHPLPPCPAIRPTRPCPASVGKREAAFSPTEVASPVGLERLRWKVNSWQCRLWEERMSGENCTALFNFTNIFPILESNSWRIVGGSFYGDNKL